MSRAPEYVCLTAYYAQLLRLHLLAVSGMCEHPEQLTWAPLSTPEHP
jgi:hypothetical protein